jgi:hypothetical protein
MDSLALSTQSGPTNGGSLSPLPTLALAEKRSEFPTVQTFKAPAETRLHDAQIDLTAETEEDQGNHITFRSSLGTPSAEQVSGVNTAR